MSIQNILYTYIQEHNIKIPNPTNSQFNILNVVFNDKCNVIVNSIPGSGKTTLIQYISLLDQSTNSQTSYTSHNINKHRNILVLMYNKGLCVESKQKFKKNKCNNIQCQTIHSFAYNNYKSRNKSYDDTLLLDILRDNPSPIFDFNYSMIIIDEFQDATPILFKFIQKILIDNLHDNPQIIVMGDPLQELYKFRGADSRFMTLASDVFLGGRYNFKSLRMEYTNRCPQEICRLINVCYFGYDSKFQIMKSHKTGGKIRVCIGHQNKIIIDEINLLKNNGVKFNMEDIMIIVPSLKNIQKLKNILASNGIYIIVSDSEHLDSKTTKNKVLITTFHGSKGLERKICFVTNFSTDYYKYYATDFDPEIISNTFYVALSRTTEYLYLIRNSNSEFPNWCSRSTLELLKNEGTIELYDEPIRKSLIIKEDENEEIKNNTVNVTELTKNLSNEFKEKFSEYVKFIKLCSPSKQFQYDDVMCTNFSLNSTNFYQNGFSIYENISKYIGQAVIILFELYLYDKQQSKNTHKNRKPYILDYIDDEIHEMKKLYPEGNVYTRYYNHFLKNSNEYTSFKDIIYYCILRDSLKNNDISILNQIKYLKKVPDLFDISDNDEIDVFIGDNYQGSKLISILESIVDDTNYCVFEKSIMCSIFNKTIVGKIDVVCDDSRIIEFKFKNTLELEDFVQLFLYQIILKLNDPHKYYHYEIFNAKTKEHYYMKSIDFDKSIELLKLIIFPSVNTIQNLTNEEFINIYKLYTIQ